MPDLSADTQFAPTKANPLETEDVGVFEQLGAAFQTGTFIGRAWNQGADSLSRQDNAYDEDFNVLDHLTPDELAQPKVFGGARNMEDLTQIRQQEERYQRTLKASQDGPINPILANFIAQFADPINYIGLGIGGGASVIARVGVAAAENAALAGGLTALQSTFDPKVSASDIAMAAGAAAGIGALARGAHIAWKGRGDMAEYWRNLATEALSPVNDQRKVINGSFGGSASAAENSDRIADELTEQVRGMKFVPNKTGDIGLQPAAMELANSDIPIVRYLAAQMYELGVTHKGALIGERVAEPALATRAHKDDAMLVELNRGLTLAFQQAKKAGEFPEGYTKAKFDTDVGEALASPGAHPIRAVQEMADHLRKTVLDPITKQVDAAGMRDVPGAPKSDPRRFPHVYLTDAIESGVRDEKGRTFVEAVADHLAAMDPKNAEFAGEVAEEVAAKISKGSIHTAGQLPRFSLEQRGPFSERALELPFDVVKPWLNTSAENVLGKYIRSVMPDLRLHQTYGTLDPEKAFGPQVKQQTNTMRTIIQNDASLTPELKQARTKALNDHEKRMMELLKFGFDELRGVREQSKFMAHGGRTGINALKALSFIKSMPMVAMAQMGDLGQIVIQEGMARAFGGFLATLTKGLRGIKPAALKEIQAEGVGLDNLLNSRMQAILGTTHDFNMDSRGDRTLAKINNVAAKVFGLPAVTVVNKTIAASAASNRILTGAVKIAGRVEQMIKAGSTEHPDELAKIAAREVLDPADLRRMALSRLSAEDMARIGGQKEHFTNAIGTKEANSEKWTDAAAMGAYRRAMATATDRAVITPHALDAPMWASSAVGRLASMYQRFMFASYHRIMVSATQQRDRAALTGAATMLGLGALSLALRDIMSGGEVKERTDAQWVRESMDRSGLVTYFFQLENLAAAMGLPTTETVVGHAGEASNATFSSRFTGSSFGGKGPIEKLVPLAGYVQDVTAAVGIAKRAIAGKEITEEQVHKASQLIPFRRVMGVGLLFDQLEHEGARLGWYTPKKED